VNVNANVDRRVKFILHDILERCILTPTFTANLFSVGQDDMSVELNDYIPICQAWTPPDLDDVYLYVFKLCRSRQSMLTLGFWNRTQQVVDAGGGSEFGMGTKIHFGAQEVMSFD
jgi:hypothetical protein